MNEKDNIRLAEIHICNLEKQDKGGIKLDLSKYPKRLCVIDETRDIAVDVETMHEYPYIRTVSMMYFLNDMEIKKIIPGKRAACIEYKSLPFLNESTDMINKCNEVMDLVKQGVTFPDGNIELTNEEYLEFINNSKENHKIKKILKKRK